MLRRLAASLYLQLICDVVESFPKVPQNVRGDRLDFQWHLVNPRDAVDALSGIELFLDADSVGVALEKSRRASRKSPTCCLARVPFARIRSLVLDIGISMASGDSDAYGEAAVMAASLRSRPDSGPNPYQRRA